MKNNRFWNWVRNEETGASEMYLYGAIAESTWFENDITPAMFRSELQKHSGDVTVFINSPGGDVFAASQIYTMLRNHPGKVTVKIDGIAASAASVVAMAGDETLISPTGMLMIHDPMTLAYGNKADMEQTITMLEEVKESILNAYVQKSHQSRETLSQLMSEETWMNAEKALELGLVDGILFADSPAPSTQTEPQPVQYSAKHTQNTLLHKLSAVAPIGIPIDQLEKRLALLKD
ncbi:MAG: head maturation protease, ClpP-related [Ruminococcus sp.]